MVNQDGWGGWLLGLCLLGLLVGSSGCLQITVNLQLPPQAADVAPEEPTDALTELDEEDPYAEDEEELPSRKVIGRKFQAKK